MKCNVMVLRLLDLVTAFPDFSSQVLKQDPQITIFEFYPEKYKNSEYENKQNKVYKVLLKPTVINYDCWLVVYNTITT